MTVSHDPVRAWRRLADTSVLLDGFHALKHAVRFQARIPVAVTTDRRAALALADELAPDVRDTLDGHLAEIPEDAFKILVPRPHPTAVAALAVRPSRAAHLETLSRTPR
ncbi:rRNA methyltransferase, partial [Streptomyces sp. HC44]|nr:rRNA methyltransferase [Streptomyces scabichelini]